MPAFSYARMSTDKQSEASITDQLRVCREAAERRALTIAREYTDEGISGAALGNRPGLLQLLDVVRHGDVLLVADLTRLSRSQELAPLLDRLRFRGVRVLGVLDGFDSDSAHARMQAGLSGLMSDELRASIRVRTHSALELRARAGTATGGRCYGYAPDGAIIDAEAEIVREIFDRFARGATLLSIASDLNARGVPAPGATWSRTVRRADARWLVSALHALLRQERYIGRVVWNRSVWVKDPDTGRRQRRERPESEWIIRDGPAIVDRSTWDAVQARHARRAPMGGGRGGQPQYLLSGILRCESCGAAMVVSGDRGRTYYCSSHRHGGEAACSMGIGVRRDVAEDVILTRVEDALLSAEAVEYAVELMRGWDRAERTRQAQVPADTADIDARIARIEAQVSAGVLEREDVAPALAALHERRIAAQRAAWRRAGSGRGTAEQPWERAYRAEASRWRTVLQARDVAAGQIWLREVLGRVPVWPEPGRGYLLARVGPDVRPLLRAAVHELVAGACSGLVQAEVVALRRAA